MNEARRMQYLEAMGVDMYVPRYVLPNAAAMRQCALPSAHEQALRHGGRGASSDNTDSEVSLSAGGNRALSNAASALGELELRKLNDGLNSVLAMLDDTPKSAAKPKSAANTGSNSPSVEVESEVSAELAQLTPAINQPVDSSSEGAKPLTMSEPVDPLSAPAVEQGSIVNTATDHAASIDTIISGLTSSAEAAQFNLNLWFLNESCIQVVDSREPADALPTEALLRNIVIAARLHGNVLPRAETQVWPFPGAPRGGDHSWSAASAMMTDFFGYRFEQAQAKGFVVLGEAAAKAVLGADISYSSLCFSSLQSERYQIPVLVLPSLRELLYQPALKSKLWPSLLQLRSGLALAANA